MSTKFYEKEMNKHCMLHNICIFLNSLFCTQQPQWNISNFCNALNNILFDVFQPSTHSAILKSFIVSLWENWTLWRDCMYMSRTKILLILLLYCLLFMRHGFIIQIEPFFFLRRPNSPLRKKSTAIDFFAHFFYIFHPFRLMCDLIYMLA